MNAPWLGANPNAAGVAPFWPWPVTPKLNGEAFPPPVDVEGVTGVNTNGDGLEPAVPLTVVVVPGVLETPKANVGAFVAGAGVDDVVVVVVPNALTGVDVVPNALPLVSGPEPGLGASCLGAENTDKPCEVPVFAGVVEFVEGKATFGSDPPVGLFAARLNRG